MVCMAYLYDSWSDYSPVVCCCSRFPLQQETLTLATPPYLPPTFQPLSPPLALISYQRVSNLSAFPIFLTDYRAAEKEFGLLTIAPLALPNDLRKSSFRAARSLCTDLGLGAVRSEEKVASLADIKQLSAGKDVGAVIKPAGAKLSYEKTTGRGNGVLGSSGGDMRAAACGLPTGDSHAPKSSAASAGIPTSGYTLRGLR